MFGPAWLTSGHSFDVENEHEQEMAACFKTSKLLAGFDLPHYTQSVWSVVRSV